MFEPFQKFIPRAASHYGIRTEVNAAKVCHGFRTLVPKLFENHEDPQNFIRPAYFKDGTLVINVSSPAWGQEVIMRKQKIIDEMNTKAGREIIKKLNIQTKKESEV